jgi:RHS repeat-associated protein
VPNSTSLNITGSITVEAWFKVNSIGAYQDILARESYGVSGSGGGYELSVTNTGKVRFDTYQGPTSWIPVIGTTTINTGVWYHVAGVWDGSYMRIYLNGVLDGTMITGYGPASGTSSLKIGRNSGGTYFNGLIDEVRVSNTVLYSSNFTPSMHLTAGANTAALWKFDGQTVADSSTNGNNGTLQGGAVYSNDVPTGDGGGGGGGGGTSQIQWLVPDQLGTPRMIFDQTGSLANMKRHDYLPFGEELFAPAGGRTTAMGYSGEGIRQQFTSKERDIETGLDYFGARYYASTQGRFASPDEPLIDQWPSSPQTWNLYVYGANNPLRFTDPDGLAHWDKTGHFVGDYDGEYNEDLQAVWVKTKKGGYWDFEKGAQRARDAQYAEVQLSIIRQRVIIKQLQREMFRQWLEDRYNRQPHGDTIFLFGPITKFNRLLGPAEEALQLGTARMNLLNAIENATLRRLVEYSYRVGARIGNGSTADVIRFEKETGILLSRTGHVQKGKEVLSALQKLLGSNKLNSKDAEIASQLINDLKDALTK